VVWTARAPIATVRWVTETRPGHDHPTRSQHVRFAFETSSLRRAVDVTTELRRVTTGGVRVRPSRLADGESLHWEVLLTTGPLDAHGILAFEEEMRRLAWEAPGVRFNGWLCLSDPVEPTADGECQATAYQAEGVLIVDDSASFRGTARKLLEYQGYRIVGEADSVAAGLEAIERLRPDAVLLDVRLPDGSGLDLCELVTREQDAPAVLLVSTDDAVDGALARAHGARDFVLKVHLANVDLRAVWAQGSTELPS
jgi:CheY-like chemotaxis protein